jgi:hypothetical protein
MANDNAQTGMERADSPKDLKPEMVDAEDYKMIQNYARAMLASGTNYLPKGVTTEEQAQVIMLTGWEIGLPPVAAMQEIYVVNGKPALQGRAMLALLDSRPDLGYYEWGDCDDESATIILHKRTPRGTWIERPWTYTRKDAERAGLWGKQGPWSNFPHLMLMWRATTMGMRAMFAGLLRGAAHSPEELGAPVRVIEGVVEVDREAMVAGMTDSPDNKKALGDGGARPDADENGEVDFETGGASGKKLENKQPTEEELARDEVRTAVADIFEDIIKPDDIPEWATSSPTDTAAEVAGLMKKISTGLKGKTAETLYLFAKAQDGVEDNNGAWDAIASWWTAGALPAQLYEALCKRREIDPDQNPFKQREAEKEAAPEQTDDEGDEEAPEEEDPYEGLFDEDEEGGDDGE